MILWLVVVSFALYVGASEYRLWRCRRAFDDLLSCLGYVVEDHARIAAASNKRQRRRDMGVQLDPARMAVNRQRIMERIAEE